MLNLYTETAFQVKPSTPASLVHIPIPRLDGSYRKLKNSNAQPPADPAYTKDERTFARHFLASQGAIYFRQQKKYPRSLHWKVIEDGQVLQIQCADMARSAADQKEAHLTLSFEFQDQILPSGVAVADADKGDTVYVFVTTSRKTLASHKSELHTLAIPTDWFRDPASIDKGTQRWCTTEEPSGFLLDPPHILHANTPFELFISYKSGKFQRLKRKPKETQWEQENYDDKAWGSSIRSMVKWGGAGTIQYGSTFYDQATVQAFVASPTHIYTVCLNHMLRVWSLETNKLAAAKDLLDRPRTPQDHYQISVAERSFIRLVKSEFMSQSILVTYSPLEGGQFKFWDVKGGLTGELVITDKYPNVKLSLPDPDPTGNTVWSLIGFEIMLGDNYRQSEMWVLFRNNNYHHTYSIHFDFNTLTESWESNWVKTSSSALARPIAPDLIKSDAQDPSCKWLEFLLFPGRYPPSVLQTALSIYENAMAVTMVASKKSRPLQERLSSTIAANVILRKYAEGDMDYERFATDTDSQWRNFWRIVETIDEGRQAPISLSLDVSAGMAWISLADRCCVVRECSATELLLHNQANEMTTCETVATERWPHRKVIPDVDASPEAMVALINTAVSFRKSFSPELARDVEDVLGEELLHDPEYPVPYRVTEFYERVNFGESISNETFNQVETEIASIGGFAGLTNNLFEAILDMLPQQISETKSALRTTIFGFNVLSAGMQETITSGRQLVLDLFLLVVFLDGEMNQEESHALNFDAAPLFVQMTALLKEYEKNCWLLSHSRFVPLEFLGPQPAPNTNRRHSVINPQEGRHVTILEDAVAKAVRPRPAADTPQSFLLTDMLGLCESWINGKDEISPDDGNVYIQCDLIVQKNIELASDFLRFQPNTAWATYIRGRLHAARFEYDMAARYFQKAAYSLACGRAVGKLNEMSAGLLSMIDAQCFNVGLPRYFQHVLEVFESTGAYSQMADFARLALQSLAPGQKEPLPIFKSEVLSRLFTAELKSSRYLSAFDALVQFSDQALQKKSMTSLITAMLDPHAASINGLGAVEMLQTLPIGLYPHLATYVDHHFETLAKRQTSIPDTGAPWSTSGEVDYLKILHAVRAAQHDYRGVMSVLLDRVRLRKTSRNTRSDPQAVELRKALLALINAMRCVAPDEAYILTEMDEQGGVGTDGMGQEIEMDGQDHARSQKKRKRIILTLDDLRRDYQQVLDRCSRIERGDFDFGIGEDSDNEDGDWAPAVPAHGQANGVPGDAMEA